MAVVKQVDWIKNITTEAAGGKAAGLSHLINWGMNVPDAFVVMNGEQGNLPKDIAKYYQQMGGGKVAVRSSAIGEDGDESSFAGLYETLLNVEGIEALYQAVDKCIASLHSDRASAYQQTQNIEANNMCVVVQKMVQPKSAGVLFTADPVSGRHDRLVIDAVEGLGEQLVSGEVTPDHYEYDNNAMCTYSEFVSSTPILSEQQQLQLVTEARQAVKKAGNHLDMEWAFDENGELFWLQARPITTIGSDLNELDTPVTDDEVITRCNVGEMIPGACSPLTFSTTGRAVEEGMQHMHVSYAGREKVTSEWTQVAMQFGYLFINLSGSAAAAATVLGIDTKALGHSICGEEVKSIKEPDKKNILIRLVGAFRLFLYIKSADKVIDAFIKKSDLFSLPLQGNSKAWVQEIDLKKPFLSEAMAVHMQSSATSGFAGSILQRMTSKGEESTAAEQAEATRLMAGATGVESAILVEQLDHIVDLLATYAQSQQHFLEASKEDALAWLLSGEIKPATDAFNAFLDRHGHRGYRELSMDVPCWADKPLELISTMQASLKARLQGNEVTQKPEIINIKNLSRGLRWILPKAHNAIRRREKTKSYLVKTVNEFKRSYRALGEQLADEKVLKDRDLIFFFTHDELVDFVVKQSGNSEAIEAWNQKLEKRRTALEFQNKLVFDDICVGVPVPIDSRQALQANEDEGVILGRPVSLGKITGTARVAFSVADAAALQPGEILVAPITDVGWTPYFNLIAGLVTDIGSAVSHGSVIAREYGLPAIVNTRVATKQIKTGDTICLDADKGMITILDHQ